MLGARHHQRLSATLKMVGSLAPLADNQTANCCAGLWSMRTGPLIDPLVSVRGLINLVVVFVAGPIFGRSVGVALEGEQH